jgi:hypothetical protein
MMHQPSLMMQPSYRIQIRRATETDQRMIASLVRKARLYPINLHWSRFLVAI